MTTHATVGSITSALWAAYPRVLADDWDTGIGLTCGDPAQRVQTVLFAIDVDDSTVEQAVAVGAELLVTHHPLLFSAVKSVAADTPKGRLIHRMLRAGVSHFAAHTNADRAIGGVNDALAAALDVANTRPIETDTASQYEPGVGLGRIGELAEPLPLRDFVARVAGALPATAAGVTTTGDPDRMINTVAVCGGAGGSLLSHVGGADAYLTADLSHHTAAEFVAEPGRPALIQVAHWASEWPWLASAAGVVEAAHRGSIRTVISRINTDAWTFHLPGSLDLGREDRF